MHSRNLSSLATPQAIFIVHIETYLSINYNVSTSIFTYAQPIEELR
jgi:hypothetical protein